MVDMDRRTASKLRGGTRISMRGKRISCDDLGGQDSESQDGEFHGRDFRGGANVEGAGQLELHKARTRTRTDIDVGAAPGSAVGPQDPRDDTVTLRKKVEQLMAMKNDIMKKKKQKEMRLEELKEKIEGRKKDRARYESHLLKIREALKDRDAALVSCKEKLKQLEENLNNEKTKKSKLNEQKSMIQRELDNSMEVYRQKVEEFKYLKTRIRKISLDLENFFARSPMTDGQGEDES
ncbi:unnamed protein product [Cyprideis torosa]|uniref:Uncharacterized protein n=1 Tax=Cyprideis torosa TaxID=163714 RepID=A0A7R8W9A5_9CRUS|nr:unnamed protein product [Cyprideis torosa]CAG0884663.1 unnamed protein product [Cyprideis torosa]